MSLKLRGDYEGSPYMVQLEVNNRTINTFAPFIPYNLNLFFNDVIQRNRANNSVRDGVSFEFVEVNLTEFLFGFINNNLREGIHNYGKNIYHSRN